MRIFLCCLLMLTFLCSGPFPALAQETPSSEQTRLTDIQDNANEDDSSIAKIGFELGLGYYQIRDHSLQNPHLFQGPLFGAALVFERDSGPWRSGFRFNLGYSSHSDAYGLPGFSAINGFEVDTQRAMMKVGTQKQWTLFAGAFVREDIDLAMYPLIDEAHLYWLTSFSVGPAFTIERHAWENTTVRAGVRFPVMAMVSRPPHERFINNDKDTFRYITTKLYENLTLRTPDQHFFVVGDASIRFKLAENIEETLGYRFTYIRNEEPSQLRILSHSLFMNISWRW